MQETPCKLLESTLRDLELLIWVSNGPIEKSLSTSIFM